MKQIHEIHKTRRIKNDTANFRISSFDSVWTTDVFRNLRMGSSISATAVRNADSGRLHSEFFSLSFISVLTIEYTDRARLMMGYRKRNRECLARMKMRANQRAAKERKRFEGPAPDYPKILPELRRVVIVIDYDFEPHVEVFGLHKTNRVDCYRMTRKDGTTIADRIGWAKSLEIIRKGFLRVSSARNL